MNVEFWALVDYWDDRPPLAVSQRTRGRRYIVTTAEDADTMLDAYPEQVQTLLESRMHATTRPVTHELVILNERRCWRVRS